MSDGRGIGEGFGSIIICFMMKEYLMTKDISVIGAGGKMGSWFTKYFSKRNDARLVLYDINPSFHCDIENCEICHTIDECVERADIVFICVPIKDIPSTLQQCASRMKPGAILAEISSVKYQSFKALKKISPEIRTLCLHPMFGPGADDIKNMNILLIPVRDEKEETSISKSLFEDALITVLPSPKIHDDLIAIVLGLTHYMNIIFGSFLSKENFDLLKKVSGTTFKLQSLLCRSIFTDAPDLVVSLLSENPSTRRYIQNYINNANKLAKLIFDGDEIKLKAHVLKTKSILEHQQNLELSYQRMYRAVKEINKDIGFD
jgi:prephenate dehydrogenase